MFNRRLKELRTENNLTQKQLANIIECNQSMITRWEKGECEPTAGIIIAFAQFFDVTTDYLLGLENEDGSKNRYSINNNNGNIHIGNHYNISGNNNKIQ